MSGERGLAVRVRGDVDGLSAAQRTLLLERASPSTSGDVAGVVGQLVADVRQRGDAALLDAAERFDGARPPSLEVPRAEWLEALQRLTDAERQALRRAERAITAFHAAQRPRELLLETASGVTLGRRPDPLARVGVYAPGGRAAYPSSVLMGAVPARVAGVGAVVVCSPAGADGRPAAAVMAACAIAGVDRLFAAGGASAIAAMAYGTTTVPRVDRVVGPGNAYVNEAKRQVSAVVGIDNPAGPSELLVLADDTADADRLAAELLAQAEHDPDAAVVLVAVDAPGLLDRTERALQRRLDSAPRAAVARAALAAGGAMLTAATPDAALAFARDYAPEHLLLCVRDADAALERVRNAGTVFLGGGASVAFGDYTTGANHVLPTGGMARVFSGLSVDDFVRWTSWQRIEPAGAAELAAPTAVLAELEGLPGHAAAALRAADGGPTASDRRDDVASAAGDQATAPDRRDDVASATGDQATASDRRDEVASAAAGAVARPRAPYRGFPLYSPRRGAVDLELSANTSRWGAAPSVRAALAAASNAQLGEYPTPRADALRGAIAERWSVRADQVVTGCGSDDLIDSAVRAFCEPGDALAYPAPTFPMAPLFARMNAARPVAVPFLSDGDVDLDRLLAPAPAVVYLCRPNNPTGALVPRGTVERLLERTDALVLVDEAYGEFAGESMLDAVVASGRGLVLRTFSKAMGLAGMRVGYALGPTELVAAVEASRGPYKVGGLAERLALAALADTEWTRRVVRAARSARDRLGSELERRGHRVHPSRANFILFEPQGVDAGALAAALRARGVGVRVFPGLGERGSLRVTVAPDPELDRFLAALDDAVAPAAQAVEGAPAGRVTTDEAPTAPAAADAPGSP